MTGDDPESAFHAYIGAFESLNVEVVLPFYHLPGLFISPQGVFVTSDVNTTRALLTQFMDGLWAQSYRRTEVSGFKVSQLSSGLASCVGVFTRFNVDGKEISRVGFNYILRHSGGSWKIVVAAIHDPLAVPTRPPSSQTR